MTSKTGQPIADDDFFRQEDPDHWSHGTATLDDIDIHYVTVAPAVATASNESDEVPLIVLLHGFPEFWYAWRHQLDPLANAGYRVVAPDLRGYNRSSAPEDVASYRTERLVADVGALVEHMGYQEAAVVGHDWGGLIGWETAIREPDLLSRLVILNAPHPAAYRRTLVRSPEQALRSWYVFLFQLPWLPERLLAVDDYRVLDELLTETAAPGAFTETDVQRYKDAMARAGSLSGPLHYYRAIVRETARRTIRSTITDSPARDEMIQTPTLVLWGEQDQALSTDLLDGLDRWVPDVRIERLPAASHWVQADDPERVNRLLLDFLD